MQWGKNRSGFSRKLIVSTFVLLFVFAGIVYAGVQRDHALRAETQQYYSTLPAPAPKKPVSTGTVYDKIKNRQEYRILIVGDSIADGSGASSELDKWYQQLTKLIFNEHKANGSVKKIATPGANVFGGWIDYLNEMSKYPEGEKPQYDLVFICFGHNDQFALSPENYAAVYENLLRRIIADNPSAEVMTIAESSLTNEAYPDIIQKLTAHYGTLSADTRIAFKNSGIPYETLAPDGVHPSSQGHMLYAQQIYNILWTQIDGGHKVALNAAPLYPKQAQFASGRIIHDFTDAKGFRKVGDRWLSSAHGSSLSAKVKGSAVGVSLMGTLDGAALDVWVDGIKVQTLDGYLPTKLNRHMLVLDNLGEGEHLVQLVQSERNDPKIKGLSMLVNGLIEVQAR